MYKNCFVSDEELRNLSCSLGCSEQWHSELSRVSVAVSKHAFLQGLSLGKDHEVDNTKMFSIVAALFYVHPSSIRKFPRSASCHTCHCKTVK